MQDILQFGDVFPVRVTPKASVNRVVVECTSEHEKRIRIYVTACAQDGKANRQVIRLLSKTLRLPQTAFKIIRGLKSKDKIIAVLRK